MNRDSNSTLKRLRALLSLAMMVLLFSPMSFADMGESLVLCKNNKTVRTLRVEMGADQKCRAIYTKQGVDETIGASQAHDACVEFISGVRKNLEEAKWNCREIKEARTSSVLIGAE